MARSIISHLDTLRPLLRAAVMTFLITTAKNLSDMVEFLPYCLPADDPPPPPPPPSPPVAGCGVAGGGLSVGWSQHSLLSSLLIFHMEKGKVKTEKARKFAAENFYQVTSIM